MAKRPRKGTEGTPRKSEDPVIPAASENQAHTDAPSTWSLIIALVLDANVRKAFYLVLIAALYTPLSQLVLSPVYGSIPSAVYHKYGVIVAAMLSFLVKDIKSVKIEQFFPAFVFWIPTIHLALFQFSSILGNPAGPLITECLTTFPLITVSMSLATRNLKQLNLSFMNEVMIETVPSMYNYFNFVIMRRTFEGLLPTWMGMNKLFTRIGLQMVAAATYTAVIPTAFIWPSLPAIAFTAVGNPHVQLMKTTDLLNNTLALYNYSLVDRQESLTGYISVLQDNNNKFKVMRCDHSLLGGEWMMPPSPQNMRRVAEPIFAVFTMLESVRLVERDVKKIDQERALNIGLGVGTAPSALITHGVDTTIIELDPAVYRFAVQHFNLPTKHKAYIGNAVQVIEAKKEVERAYYDYIIHDVFTGGAEPVDLFTVEFLGGLKQMLKPDGVIAINYAGDLALPSTSLIYRTVTQVFSSCRIFREDEQVGEDGMAVVDEYGQFTNMVFICRRDGRTVTFRKPVEADYLGSASRRSYMMPKHEVLASQFEPEGDFLRRDNRKVLEKMQVESAIGHWKLLRKVLPAAVWELW